MNAQEIPADLQAAIETNITDRGYTYAGDCDETTIDDDTGKWCSSIFSMTEDRVVVRIGVTFAEFLRRVTFEKQGATWVVVSDVSENLGAPQTGTGLTLRASSGNVEPWVLIGPGVMAVSAAAFAVTRARPR